MIENPASVIKELIENAIDAGATELEVVTKGGGRSLIQASDNGKGISKEDLPMALLRHATSKISEEDDLFALSTFGFRGQALASIAAISKITLLSSIAKETVGELLRAEGGKIVERASFSRQRGTTIEVRDLFFNVPVREDFKSILSETKKLIKF